MRRRFDTPAALHRGAAKTAILAGVVIAGALVAALIALLMHDPYAQRGSRLSADFSYDLEHVRPIPAELLTYSETATIPTGMSTPRGIAAAGDRLYVAGDHAVKVFSLAGALLSEVSLGGAPQCITVAPDGDWYLGMRDVVEVRTPEGGPKAVWEAAGPKALFTSVAVAETQVFVGDAGRRLVLVYGRDGTFLSTLGTRDDDRGIPGIVTYSPNLDVAMAPDGLLRVANPGRHRIEAYTLEGDLAAHWGHFSNGIEGFCGCCNPAHFAVMPDGRLVTSEKGLTTVKVLSAFGALQAVVAGPEQLGTHASVGFDVAVCPEGRVLVLDPVARVVRIYAPRSETAPGEPSPAKATP